MLTDEQVQAIRGRRAEVDGRAPLFDGACVACGAAPADIDALLAEVERLRLNLQEIAGGDPTLGAYFKTLAMAALDGAGVE